MFANMKGWRTVLWNAVIVGGGAVGTYLAGIDWTQYLSPTAALIVTAVVNVGLRIVTKTPVGVK